MVEIETLIKALSLFSSLKARLRHSGRTILVARRGLNLY